MRRKSYLLGVVLLLALPAAAQAKTGGPPHSEVQKKKCPVCVVVAGVAVEEVVGVGLLGAAAGYSAYQIHHAIGNGQAAGYKVARRPHIHRAYMRKMREFRGDGRRIWHSARGKLKGLVRYVKHRASWGQIKRRWPGAAFACALAFTVSYVSNGHPKDSLYACVGAGVGKLVN